MEPAKLSTLGHVQVFAEDAAADEGGEISFIAPQNNYRLIPEPQKVIDTVLREEPRLQAGIARLMVGALLSSGDVSMEGLLIGIDPRARAAAYPALDLREGRFFEPGEKGILLNRGVARKLGVGVGGTVVALGTTSDGRLSGVKLTVTGVWKVGGLDAYEWGSCFVDLAAIQELLDAGDAAGVLVFRQRDGDLPSAPVAASVTAALRRHGIRARAWTWEEMGGPFLGGMIVTRFVGATPVPIPIPDGERVPAGRGRARVAHHAADPRALPQLAGQPDRRRPEPRRPHADRGVGRGARPVGRLPMRCARPNCILDGHEHVSTLPGMAERTIILDGFSKTFAMTGWRLGYAIVPTSLIPTYGQLIINTISCAPTFAQVGAAAALTGPQDDVEAMVVEFKARRDLIVAGLDRSRACAVRCRSGRSTRSRPSPARDCPARSWPTDSCTRRASASSPGPRSVAWGRSTSASRTPIRART